MYAVRRYLYFSWDEWEALPDWQRWAYDQALQEAQPWARQSEAIDPKAKKKGQQSGGQGESFDATAGADQWAQHGAKVNNG